MFQRPFLLIGIDDTDQKNTTGTGRLARGLLDELVGIGCEPSGVTRHQFLIDPRIPYTSHNSAACLAVSGSINLQQLQQLCLSFLRSKSAKGSSPGLCVAWQEQIPDEVMCFGQTAQQQVVQIEQALSLAQQNNLWLEG